MSKHLHITRAYRSTRGQSVVRENTELRHGKQAAAEHLRELRCDMYSYFMDIVKTKMTGEQGNITSAACPSCNKQ